MREKKKSLSIDERLFTVKFSPDEVSHIEVDQSICKLCEQRICLHVCPANVYEYDDEFCVMNVNYENCLECGTCKICCKHIKWKYPEGNFGANFNFG